jgi:hypothetical protein
MDPPDPDPQHWYRYQPVLHEESDALAVLEPGSQQTVRHPVAVLV